MDQVVPGLMRGSLETKGPRRATPVIWLGSLSHDYIIYAELLFRT